MQQTQNGFQGSSSRIIFGTTRAERNNALRVCLTVCSFVAIFVDTLARMLSAPLLWSCFGLMFLLWLFVILYYAEEICFDLDKGIYTFEKGFLLDTTRLDGRLTDIAYIRLERNVDRENKVSYSSWLVFAPPLRREPLCFQGLYLPHTPELFEAQMLQILETVARLGVPLHDETGWRGSWRTPCEVPKLCIIPPGEPHPSTLLP
ncbi:MAG: hypothetical protein V4671_05565, partial [Armatimonadota bacterium]